MSDFPEFPKIPRLTRECTISEKIDGTNALISVTREAPEEMPCYALENKDGERWWFRFGSRTRWLTKEDDNYGFAKWAFENMPELVKLGEGNHYGEWWGKGIQKGHSNKEKTFSLFNTHRWSDASVRPSCCSVVPILYTGIFDSECIDLTLHLLQVAGSKANPGMMNPEGVIIYHHAAGQYFKKLCKNDDVAKSAV